MKKFLLTAALVLALVTSLTAGTMAYYTANVATFTSDIRTKTFSLDTVGTDTFNTNLEIIPGESVEYTILVNNTGEVDAITTVDASLSSIETGTDFGDIPGLTATVAKSGTGNTVPLTSSAESTIEADESDTYTVTVTWARGDEWSHEETDAYMNEDFVLTINANAIQVTSSVTHAGN